MRAQRSAPRGALEDLAGLLVECRLELGQHSWNRPGVMVELDLSRRPGRRQDNLKRMRVDEPTEEPSVRGYLMSNTTTWAVNRIARGTGCVCGQITHPMLRHSPSASRLG